MSSPERKTRLIIKYQGTEDEYSYRQAGNLQSEHHLLYTALRQRDLLGGFKPLKHEGRLHSAGGDPYGAFHGAMNIIRYVSEYAETALTAKKFGGKLSSYQLQQIEDLLKPFGGTVDLEMLIAAKKYIFLNKPV